MICIDDMMFHLVVSGRANLWRGKDVKDAQEGALIFSYSPCEITAPLEGVNTSILLSGH